MRGTDEDASAPFKKFSRGWTQTLPKGAFLLDETYILSSIDKAWDNDGDLGPVIEERAARFDELMERIKKVREELARNPAAVPAGRQELDRLEHQARETLLDIKVCDPAMGSGHFLVEAVDLYPTLADYCQIGLPDHLEGQSLLPLIQGKVDQVKKAAFSQVKALRENTHLLAYSLRTPRYRYVEWREWKSKRIVARELYDHNSDPNETRNVANQTERSSTTEELARILSRNLHREWSGRQP